MNPIFFAIMAAIVFGAWTVFHKLASPHINQIFGAILVSLVAVLAGSIWLLPQLKNIELVTNPKGIVFLILAGISAFFIDFFALQAYSKGLSISVGGPIIIGGSIAIAVTIGIFLGDSFSLLKLLGLALLLTGAILLTTTS